MEEIDSHPTDSVSIEALLMDASKDGVEYRMDAEDDGGAHLTTSINPLTPELQNPDSNKHFWCGGFYQSELADISDHLQMETILARERNLHRCFHCHASFFEWIHQSHLPQNSLSTIEAIANSVADELSESINSLTQRSVINHGENPDLISLFYLALSHPRLLTTLTIWQAVHDAFPFIIHVVKDAYDNPFDVRKCLPYLYFSPNVLIRVWATSSTSQNTRLYLDQETIPHIDFQILKSFGGALAESLLSQCTPHQPTRNMYLSRILAPDQTTTWVGLIHYFYHMSFDSMNTPENTFVIRYAYISLPTQPRSACQHLSFLKVCLQTLRSALCSILSVTFQDAISQFYRFLAPDTTVEVVANVSDMFEEIYSIAGSKVFEVPRLLHQYIHLIKATDDPYTKLELCKRLLHADYLQSQEVVVSVHFDMQIIRVIFAIAACQEQEFATIKQNAHMIVRSVLLQNIAFVTQRHVNATALISNPPTSTIPYSQHFFEPFVIFFHALDPKSTESFEILLQLYIQTIFIEVSDQASVRSRHISNTQPPVSWSTLLHRVIILVQKHLETITNDEQFDELWAFDDYAKYVFIILAHKASPLLGSITRCYTRSASSSGTAEKLLKNSLLTVSSSNLFISTGIMLKNLALGPILWNREFVSNFFDHATKCLRHIISLNDLMEIHHDIEALGFFDNVRGFLQSVNYHAEHNRIGGLAVPNTIFDFITAITEMYTAIRCSNPLAWITSVLIPALELNINTQKDRVNRKPFATMLQKSFQAHGGDDDEILFDQFCKIAAKYQYNHYEIFSSFGEKVTSFCSKTYPHTGADGVPLKSALKRSIGQMSTPQSQASISWELGLHIDDEQPEPVVGHILQDLSESDSGHPLIESVAKKASVVEEPAARKLALSRTDKVEARKVNFDGLPAVESLPKSSKELQEIANQNRKNKPKSKSACEAEGLVNLGPHYETLLLTLVEQQIADADPLLQMETPMVNPKIEFSTTKEYVDHFYPPLFEQFRIGLREDLLPTSSRSVISVDQWVLGFSKYFTMRCRVISSNQQFEKNQVVHIQRLSNENDKRLVTVYDVEPNAILLLFPCSEDEALKKAEIITITSSKWHCIQLSHIGVIFRNIKIFKNLHKLKYMKTILSPPMSMMKQLEHEKNLQDLVKNPRMGKYLPSFDRDQQLAIMAAVHQQEVTLIRGPSGTGKSHTILAIVRTFRNISHKARILVCAPDDITVDQLVVRINKDAKWETTQKRVAVRYGSNHDASEEAYVHYVDAIAELNASQSEQSKV
eukprot:TRINITY_DN6016_c0_g1_i6.p1 TRINITY_DN6016_c0_g1~~TRINITY_DN6016_c0_g1_i6.p1  ORF type:complete len:1277 (-),score=217.37 TRINITY_DN6016_c0_g1_i6:2063-5893(-)